ncbi:MAG: lectin-like protein [Planctomycetota bacterium]
MRVASFLAFLLLAPWAAAQPDLLRGPFRHPMTGHDYYVSIKTQGIRPAKALAARLGGYLVVLDDADEERWLAGQFGTADTTWIGLERPAVGQPHRWVNGSTSTYRNWCRGEPSTATEIFAMMNWCAQTRFPCFQPQPPGCWNDGDGINDFGSRRVLIEVEPDSARLLTPQTHRANDLALVPHASMATPTADGTTILALDHLPQGGAPAIAWVRTTSPQPLQRGDTRVATPPVVMPWHRAADGAWTIRIPGFAGDVAVAAAALVEGRLVRTAPVHLRAGESAP